MLKAPILIPNAALNLALALSKHLWIQSNEMDHSTGYQPATMHGLGSTYKRMWLEQLKSKVPSCSSNLH